MIDPDAIIIAEDSGDADDRDDLGEAARRHPPRYRASVIVVEPVSADDTVAEPYRQTTPWPSPYRQTTPWPSPYRQTTPWPSPFPAPGPFPLPSRRPEARRRRLRARPPRDAGERRRAGGRPDGWRPGSAARALGGHPVHVRRRSPRLRHQRRRHRDRGDRHGRGQRAGAGVAGCAANGTATAWTPRACATPCGVTAPCWTSSPRCSQRHAGRYAVWRDLLVSSSTTETSTTAPPSMVTSVRRSPRSSAPRATATTGFT